MRIEIAMDYQIMRRSRRHLIMTPQGEVLYAANGFADAIQWLKAHEISSVDLCAGEHRLTLEIGGGLLVVHDPRQVELPLDVPRL